MVELIAVMAGISMLMYGSYTDVRERRVPNETWYPFLAVGLFLDGVVTLSSDTLRPVGYAMATAPVVYFALHSRFDREDWDALFDNHLSFRGAGWLFFAAGYVLAWGGIVASRVAGGEAAEVVGGLGISVLLALSFVLLVRILSVMTGSRLMGGADLKALLVIAVLVPAFPDWVLEPGLFEVPVVTVLMNGLLAGLIYPVALFVGNLAAGNTRYPSLMFIGRPMPLDEVDPVKMRLLEKVESGERVQTKSVPATTEALREFREAGVDEAWTTFLLPFIVFLLAGFLVAVTYGDVYTAILRLVMPL